MPPGLSTTAIKRELCIYTEFQSSISQSQKVNIIKKESCYNNNNHNVDKTNNNNKNNIIKLLIIIKQDKCR